MSRETIMFAFADDKVERRDILRPLPLNGGNVPSPAGLISTSPGGNDAFEGVLG